jgi:hypothetical protein
MNNITEIVNLAIEFVRENYLIVYFLSFLFPIAVIYRYFKPTDLGYFEEIARRRFVPILVSFTPNGVILGLAFYGASDNLLEIGTIILIAVINSFALAVIVLLASKVTRNIWQ